MRTAGAEKAVHFTLRTDRGSAELRVRTPSHRALSSAAKYAAEFVMRHTPAAAAAEQMDLRKMGMRKVQARKMHELLTFPNEKRHWLVKQDSQAERARFYGRECLHS